MKTVSYINNDILIEILKRLPAKTLLRFKSVQKSWYRLIKSPRFISIYTDHHKNKTAVAVYSATKKFEEFLNADPNNMAAVLAQLSYNWGNYFFKVHYNWGDYKKLQHELEGMQSYLEEVEEKYDHFPVVITLLSEIRRLAFKLEKALDSDFIQLVLRRRSVSERMLSGVLCCLECNERKRRIHNVFNGIKSLVSHVNYLKVLIAVTWWENYDR